MLKPCILACLCIISSLTVWAQLDAAEIGIEPSIKKGCSPLVVQFQDTSSSNSIVYREFVFGNGNSSSGNNTSAAATYGNSGFYTVEYIVSDGIDTISIIYTDLIEVFTPPILDFTVNPSSGCAPLQVQFINNSQPGSAPISTYVWNFGDGSAPSTQTSPTHFYTFGNVYGPTLSAMDTNGCSSNFVGPTVQARNQPVASFTAIPSNLACAPPHTVFLQNNSVGSQLTFDWTIGNGSSSLTSPTLSYSSPTVESVTLVVTDQFGCTDTMAEPNYISVGTLDADFTFPNKICVGEPVQFFNSSTGGANFSWDFGNGSTDVLEDPITSYNAVGTYTVSLTIASSDGACQDTQTHTVEVVGVTAQFSATPTEGCEVPHVVQFTNQSTGTGTSATQFYWEFDTIWNNSTDPNPTFTYNTSGLYDILLVATSPEGCVDSLVANNHILVDVPSLSIGANPIEGCVPLDVTFQDLTVSNWPIQAINWDLGNGQTSSSSTVNTTYTQTGEYPVTLEVQTTNGCTLTTDTIVYVGSQQAPNFTISDPISCAFDTLYFDNLSFDTNLIDEYQWDFGDGGGSTEFEPVYVHNDTGFMAITLVTNYNGCRDTLTIDSMYYSVGPVVNFSEQVICPVDYQVNFNGNIVMADSFYWDFGDSSPFNTIDTAPSHVFTVPTNYQVMLHAGNDSTGCFYERIKTIQLRDPIAKIQFNDSTLCLEDMLTINGTVSQHATQYFWDLGFPNQPTIQPFDMMSASLPGPGTYTAELIVADQNSCRDTTTLDYYITKPIANYSVSTAAGCDTLAVQFNNLSTSDTTLVAYDWSYLTMPLSAQTHPLVNYSMFSPNVSKHNTQLIAFDTFGCTDTLHILEHISVYKPDAHFSYSLNNACVNQTITFVISDFHSSYNYEFHLGDGTTGYPTNSQYTYQYSQSGDYYPSLTVTDSMGCDSTYVLPDAISIHNVDSAQIWSSISDTTCYPANIIFYQDVDFTGGPFTYFWDFGDGFTNTTAADSVFHNYTLPGNFDVTFAITNAYGCTDTLQINDFISIEAPLAEIVISDDTLCLGEPFTVDISDTSWVENIIWDFGDGTVDQLSAPFQNPHSHVYQQTGNLSIIMIYEGANGSCVKQDTVAVSVGTVNAEMSTIDTAGCVPFTVNFASQSTSSNQEKWYLNNVSISNLTADFYTIQAPGTFDLALVSTNTLYGCKDTAYQMVNVYPLPNIGITPDQRICVGDSVFIDGLGHLLFEWSGSVPFDSIDLNTIGAQPDTNALFTVVGTDINQCKDSISTQVLVQQIPEITYYPNDTVIFEGQELPAFFSSNESLTYSWSPPEIFDCPTCPDPTIRTNTSQPITLIYQDQNGCFVSDTTFFLEIDANYNLNLPNAFTPNGDGINDYFNFKAYGVKRIISFEIFNRWGEKVFETNELEPGWDGTYKGQIQKSNSVFYYRLEVERFNGETFPYQGKIILLSK